MTRQEHIAKKAAQAAALATYRAILNPPVWKVAGTSFTTSPTVEDIAKAAAAASYTAVLKMAQATPPPGVPVSPEPPDFSGIMGKAPSVWKAPVPNPAKDSIFGTKPKTDSQSADAMNLLPVAIDLNTISVAISAVAPEFSMWVQRGGKGPLPLDVMNFVQYVKNGGKFGNRVVGENWANIGNWDNIVAALAPQIGTNAKALQQLSGMI